MVTKEKTVLLLHLDGGLMREQTYNKFVGNISNHAAEPMSLSISMFSCLHRFWVSC